MTPLYAENHSVIRIGTAEMTGIYYPVGLELCKFWNITNKIDNFIVCDTLPTRGSVMNLNLLEKHELDFAIVQSDMQSHAYNGSLLFSRRNHNKNLRAVFILHDEPITVVARKAANIQKLDDLRGKRVNMGSPASGYRATLEVVMRMKGMTMSDFALATELNPELAAKALCNNQIDAFIYAVGHPNSAIKEAAEHCEIHLVDVDDHQSKKLVKKTPFYYDMIIPAHSYKTIDTPTHTFGIKAVLVTHANEDPDIVYRLVESVFTHFEAFKKVHPIFSSLTPKDMIQNHVIPLHPGAEKYYREQKWID